jgi:putative N6-adenine-specific DNA methylase
LHKRGYRVAQTEAPINEVLAAGIILMSGYRGQAPFVDPMCGSGTFAIEAALIAANINLGVFRRGFAFEHWNDFDADLFDRLYNDDSQEREVKFPIIGCDISPVAAEIARRNVKGAGMAKYVDIQVKPLSAWEEAPVPAGYVVTNPPYGERISAPDMDALYELIGTKLKRVFPGWQAWIIGYREEYFQKIGLAPGEKVSLLNGSLDCELRQYVLFEGNKRDFRAAGGKLKTEKRTAKKSAISRKPSDRKFSDRKPAGKFDDRKDRKFADRKPRFDKAEDRQPAVESENPLAKRRNPDALKSLIGRTPQLPPSQGTIMRSRGWKKKS